MKKLVIAAIAAAIASSTAVGVAHADDGSNGNSSITVTTVNGVTTVVVNGRQVFGAEAEKYIAEAKARAKAAREAAFGQR